MSDVHLLDLHTNSWRALPSPTFSLTPRFRHSATKLQLNDQSFLLIFGGRTSAIFLLLFPSSISPFLAILASPTKNKFVALNSVIAVQLSTSSFEFISELPLSSTSSPPPSPRHSHTSTPIRNNTAFILFGGMDEIRRFNDVHLASLVMEENQLKITWKQLNCTGNLPSPRFSHSCVYVSAKSPSTRDSLVVIGGCSPGAQNDAYLLDLQDLIWRRIDINVDSSSILLVKNSFVLFDSKFLISIGGGATCFSFGTHLNDSFMSELVLNPSESNRITSITELKKTTIQVNRSEKTEISVQTRKTELVRLV